jgi:hypothetical protein
MSVVVQLLLLSKGAVKTRKRIFMEDVKNEKMNKKCFLA